MTDKYKYGYLGQEKQDELGLNWHTYRYRNADPSLGRFFGVDPITEKFYNISAYQFAHNSPAWKIEIEGLVGFDLSATAGQQAATEAIWSWVGQTRASLLNLLARAIGDNRRWTGNGYVGYVQVKNTENSTSDTAIETVKDVVNVALGFATARTGTSGLMSKAPNSAASKIVNSFDNLTGINKIDPKDIRFSQSSVNGADDIIKSMKENGWKGDPIDVVQMNDGGLTSIDNTGVLAAHEAGIDVVANVHKFDDPLPSNLVERFTTKNGTPSTWGGSNRI